MLERLLILTPDAERYLRDTEHAVRHLFAGIEACEGLLEDLTPPSQAQTMGEVNRYMAAATTYFGRSFSEATLCGSVLQVAFMGLFRYSKNTNISTECRTLVRPENAKAIRFCVGRRVHGVPIGLLIYAGRNQFNHWDDEAFDYPTAQVFNALMKAHYNNPLFDMWRTNSTTPPGPSRRTMWRWMSFAAYETDMRALLAESC